jgi:membrane protein DedA with SNARE-associated domain
MCGPSYAFWRAAKTLFTRHEPCRLVTIIVELLLIKYGLLAVFLASLLEADVIPVLAGAAAHRGCFHPALGIIAVSGGALAGDCFWFYVGRHKVIQNSTMFLRLRPKAEALFRWVGVWQIPTSHVVYGTRMATMTWLGARGSAFWLFALADGLSCLFFSTLLLTLGFALSASAQIVLVRVRRIEVMLLVTVTLFGLIFYFLRKRRTNRQFAHPAANARGTNCTTTGERTT